MTIKQLKYLLEVEKTGSINKASKNLYVTQPNITKTLKELETELGVMLFIRSNKVKKTVFTAEGKELFEYARSLTEQFRIVEENFKDKRLKINIASQHFSFVVSPFIEIINKKFISNFELSLTEGSQEEIIENVINKKSSIGFISIYDESKVLVEKYFKSKGLEFISLKKIVPHIFIRRMHPLSKHKKVNFEDLKKYTAVIFQQEANAINYYEEILNAKRFNKKILVTDRDTVFSILKNTDGYNMGTGILINKYVGDDLISIPIDSDIKYNIGYIKIENMVLNKHIQQFLQLVVQYLK